MRGCLGVRELCAGRAGARRVLGDLSPTCFVCCLQGVEMFSVVSFPNTGPQTMYPDHCVLVRGSCLSLMARKVEVQVVWLCGWLCWCQGSDGAVLIEGLRKKPTDIHVTVGLDPRSDAGMLRWMSAIMMLCQVQRASPN